MINRRTLLVASMAAGALLLSACSGTSSTSDTATGGASGSSEPVTLTFQSLSDQPAAIAATKSIVDQWNKDNPDIQVEIVQAGWDGIYDKLITQFNGGSAPDIIHYEAASIVGFAKDGYLADLSDQMSPEFKKDVPAGTMSSVTVDGKIIAYPTELQSYMVFANKKMLEDAGVQIPTGDTMTWDQLREIAKATTKDGKYGLGWGLKSPTATFMTMAPQFGGKFFDGSGADATLTLDNGELTLPELVNTMNTQDHSILPVTLTQSGGETLASFYAGDVAMTIQGSYQAANMATDAPSGLDWIVLPPLAGPDGAGQAANPQTLSINVDSPHVAEAAKFLDFFTEPANLAALNQADALIPASTSAQQMMAKNLSDKPYWATILSSGQYMTEAPYLFVDAYAQWKDTVATPAFQKYLAGEIDSTGLAKELQDGWDQVNS